MAYFFNQSAPSTAQLISAGFIVVALGFLSPLHHFDRLLAKLKAAFARPRVEPATGLSTPADLHAAPDELIPLPPPRLILFVCSGNTCRSPMAAAIAKTEIAARLGIPFAEVANARVRAMSAGVTAKVGEPMTDEAKEALRQLGFHPNGHRARSVTPELAAQAEKIFCMTQAHRDAVLALAPAVTGKTDCLDPDGDIPDPIGSGLETYVECAERIHSLVQSRFDQLNIQNGFHG